MFCELYMMVSGAIGSFKTLLYSMALVLVPLFGVALVLRESLGGLAAQGKGAQMFSDLGHALFTLFRCFVAGDCTYDDGIPLFVSLAENFGWFYGVLYCLVQFLMMFGLFNVIV